MKKIIITLGLLFTINSAFGATPPPPARYSVFSTSSDWESLSGLRFSEFNVKFSRGKGIGNTGWELYYFDGFPCYGQAEYVETWVSPSKIFGTDSHAFIRITCLATPKELKFSYRETARDSISAQADGMITCTLKDWTVNLDECTKTKWSELGK